MVLRATTGGLRMAFSPNSISRDSHNGTPATAVRFGSHPALPVGQCLVGQKGFQDVPYESGPVDRLLTATCGLRIVFSLYSILRNPHNGTPFGRPLRYRIQAMKMQSGDDIHNRSMRHGFTNCDLRPAACEWRFLRTAFYGIPTTGRQPPLSVLAATRHFPLVSAWWAKKAFRTSPTATSTMSRLTADR